MGNTSVGQGQKGLEGWESLGHDFFWSVVGKAGQCRGSSLSLASLNNFQELRAIGMVPPCLVLVPGMTNAEEYCLLGIWPDRGGIVLD